MTNREKARIIRDTAFSVFGRHDSPDTHYKALMDGADALELMDELTAYRASRLTPEQCEAWRVEMDTGGVTPDIVAEWALAKIEGRLDIRPHAERTPIWRVEEGFECLSDCCGGNCRDCTATSKRVKKRIRDGLYFDHFDRRELGKTVFLTRETAEAAIVTEDKQ